MRKCNYLLFDLIFPSKLDSWKVFGLYCFASKWCKSLIYIKFVLEYAHFDTWTYFDILDWFYFAYAQYFDLVGLSIIIIEITNKLFPRLWSADFIFNEDHW